jgi:hypothetical protein
MNTASTTTTTLTEPLSTIRQAPLKAIRADQAARVVRRIVDNESLVQRLDIAAFNSAP